MKRSTLLIIFLLISYLFCSAQNIPSVKIKDLNDREFDTASLKDSGKPVIISFFALWCKQCIKELDAIHQIYNEWQEETGVKIYIVSTDDQNNSSKTKSIIKEHNWQYEILLDSEGIFKQAMNVNLIPAVFIADENGKIVFSRTGYTEGAEKQLITEIRKILSKKE